MKSYLKTILPILLIVLSTLVSFGQKINFKKHFYPLKELQDKGKTYVYQVDDGTQITYQYEYLKYNLKENKLLHEIRFSNRKDIIKVELTIDKKGIVVKEVTNINDLETSLNLTDGAYFAFWKMSLKDTMRYSHLLKSNQEIPCEIRILRKNVSYNYQNKQQKCTLLKVTSLRKTAQDTLNETNYGHYAKGIGLIHSKLNYELVSNDETKTFVFENTLIGIQEGKFFE